MKLREERELQGRFSRGKLLSAFFVAGALLAPAAAQAAPPVSVFNNNVPPVPCTVQADGITFCTDSPRSTVDSPVDGAPIDVNVGLPDESEFGSGPYPLMMLFHGYAGVKSGLGPMRPWLERGYATFSMTNRGFRESCGSPASRAADPTGCANGYVRLIDNRYEPRDAQEFAGMLADENLIDPQRIGAVGGSYGGGMSMALGALKNRKMLLDYSLVPWTSPGGKPMRIAATAPYMAWTDLAYSMMPERQHARLRRRRALPRAPGGHEAVLLQQPLRSGPQCTGLLRADRDRSDGRPDRLANALSGR